MDDWRVKVGRFKRSGYVNVTLRYFPSFRFGSYLRGVTERENARALLFWNVSYVGSHFTSSRHAPALEVDRVSGGGVRGVGGGGQVGVVVLL